MNSYGCLSEDLGRELEEQLLDILKKWKIYSLRI